MGATALVTDSYRPAERAKVQALNDFLVFGTVALASFGAGSLLSSAGWLRINVVMLPLLGLTLTLLAYQCGLWLFRRSGQQAWANPVPLAILFIGSLLMLTGTPYEKYFEGAQFVHFLLGPATVALAVPLYAQWKHLKRMALPLLAALLAGSAAAAFSAMGIAAWSPSLLLAPFLAFFMLRDGWRFRKFLIRAVPNAYFERSLYLMDQIDRTARLYFVGLIELTLLDTFCLAGGLWLIGVSGPLLLGFLTAVLAWIPYIGSVLGCVLVLLVAATDFPGDPSVVYAAVGLFVAVRLLDDFVFMPMTIGKSLNMHPLLTVLMIFVGGAVAGVPGLMLVLPVLGVIMVLGENIGQLVTDPRLRARHAHERALQQRLVEHDLTLS